MQCVWWMDHYHTHRAWPRRRLPSLARSLPGLLWTPASQNTRSTTTRRAAVSTAKNGFTQTWTTMARTTIPTITMRRRPHTRRSVVAPFPLFFYGPFRIHYSKNHPFILVPSFPHFLLIFPLFPSYARGLPSGHTDGGGRRAPQSTEYAARVVNRGGGVL